MSTTTTEITEEIQEQLNLSAVLMENFRKNIKHDSWFGLDPENENHKYLAKKLLKTYDIKSARELRNSVYAYEIIRKTSNNFRNIACKLRIYSEEEYINLLENQKYSIDRNYYRIVWPHRFSLFRTSLSGYDLAMAIFLLRMGGAAGFINETEMELRLADISASIKKDFNDWDSFHENVLIGHQFMTANMAPDVAFYANSEQSALQSLRYLKITNPHWFTQW
ncbi:DUF1266 domain-containing protein [Flavobacterium beibuense]|uniref:DUF1266 domain-containing protein n=1 Tax=Flavobacterium beibuense F44-8 TaxID=1406840 RepID=A0A0A2M308_9FLAO|nr:DUF1266 domain-containing protein [Flavobacterium beibuense]KGO82690.1 hypothetical protein Q763_06255 [Flavobacterium beibuense F44-8]